MNSKKPVATPATDGGLFNSVRLVIEQARGQIKQTVNSQMVQAYWHVGRLIVEEEQQGKVRAEYGKAQLKQLSSQLSRHFGKGFDSSNLRNMRRFYLVFPIQETVSPELSWSHFNLLARQENLAMCQCAATNYSQ